MHYPVCVCLSLNIFRSFNFHVCVKVNSLHHSNRKQLSLCLAKGCANRKNNGSGKRQQIKERKTDDKRITTTKWHQQQNRGNRDQEKPTYSSSKKKKREKRNTYISNCFNSPWYFSWCTKVFILFSIVFFLFTRNGVFLSIYFFIYVYLNHAFRFFL